MGISPFPPPNPDDRIIQRDMLEDGPRVLYSDGTSVMFFSRTDPESPACWREALTQGGLEAARRRNTPRKEGP